jgi:hypothetical protein
MIEPVLDVTARSPTKEAETRKFLRRSTPRFSALPSCRLSLPQVKRLQRVEVGHAFSERLEDGLRRHFMREPVPVDLTVETIAFAKVDSTNWFPWLLLAPS